MKTTLKTYWFDITDPEHKQQYNALCQKMKAQGVECFETWGGRGSHGLGDKFNNGVVIELETNHIFNNQWNTAPFADYTQGCRVFDWAQDYPINFSKNIKKGHYLELTQEMKQIRDNTHACGYCGKQEPAQKGYVFCPHCLDSEYLEEKNLNLLRMQAVSNKKNRAELTKTELDYLLPLYTDAQLHGSTTRGKARIAKQRADIIAGADKTIKRAKAEKDGFLWLLDRGVKIDNCIYYSHTETFCFGWRNPVSDDVKSKLLDILTEFPFAYEIKGQSAKISTKTA